MRVLLLSALFLAPVLSFAASFSIEVAAISEGESAVATVYVLPEGETVYTAQAALTYDQDSLAVSNILYADGVLPLAIGEYDSEADGRLVKTGGFPGGVGEKTPLMTFTLSKTAGGVSVLALEGTSQILDKDGNNIFSGTEVQTFGSPESPTVPAEFSVSETSPALTEVEEIVGVEPLITPEQADIDLPAAVITSQGELPLVPLLVVLLILIAAITVYGIVRIGRKVRG